MSRAAVVDFPEFLRQVESGRLRAATDVFPEEPVAANDPVRRIGNLLLSAHRTGGIREAFYEIGRMTVADAELILQGLPPLSCRRAQPETVGRSRSKPVRSEEHTSELQSLMRISYAVFCLKKKKINN